jgi:hypothetical protein
MNRIIEISDSSSYNPEFVQKLLNAYYNDKRVTIDAEKLWESI